MTQPPIGNPQPLANISTSAVTGSQVTVVQSGITPTSVPSLLIPAQLEIRVEVEFRIDLAGNAHVKDRKFVRNLGSGDQQLHGPFVQGIRQQAGNVIGRDSDGNVLTCHRSPNPDTSEIQLNFNPPGRDFIIPATQEKWFEIEYDASGFATRVGDGLFFSTRSGNVLYETQLFQHFSFKHTYIFDLSKQKRLQRIMNYYDVVLLNFPGEVQRSSDEISISINGTLAKQQRQTFMILLQAHYRKGLALVLSALAGAAAKEVIIALAKLIA